MRKLIKKINKHSNILLLLIYIIGVILYGYLTSKMTSICIKPKDEELYVNMARSFFYDGNFAVEYKCINYNCVIYSIVISLAYFFYSAENIVTFMRLIGVVLIVSSVFPIYFLSLKVLKSKIKALGLAIFGLIIPEIGLSAYVIQEVMLYPVFLWTIYLVYLKFSGKESKILDIVIIALFAIMFFIKSYAIAFAFAYFIALFYASIKKIDNVLVNDKKEIIKIIVSIMIFIAICGLLYLGIYAINNFEKGTNHYSSQIASIFPITFDTIISFIYGNTYYTIFFLFCTGILPVIIPILNIKKYKDRDRKFIFFLLMCLIVAIAEISLIVFVPEESHKIFPYKFCYRYLFVLMMPFLIMFMKIKEEDIKINKTVCIIYVIVFTYVAIYYIGQGMVGIGLIIDVPLITAIQHEATFDTNMLTILTFSILTLIVLFKNLNGKIKSRKLLYIIVSVLVLTIYTPRYWISNLYISNEAMGGNALKSDFIAMKEYVTGNFDKIYLIGDEIGANLWYNYQVKAFGATLNVGYKGINYGETDNIEGEKICLIVSKFFEGKIEGADKIDIGTEYIDIYVSDKVYDTLKIDY